MSVGLFLLSSLNELFLGLIHFNSFKGSNRSGSFAVILFSWRQSPCSLSLQWGIGKWSSEGLVVVSRAAGCFAEAGPGFSAPVHPGQNLGPVRLLHGKVQRHCFVNSTFFFFKYENITRIFIVVILITLLALLKQLFCHTRVVSSWG